MSEQAIATSLLWVMLALLFVASAYTIRHRHHVPWIVFLTFLLGSALFVLSAAIVATGRLFGGPVWTSPEIAWTVILIRALALAILAGVGMRVTMRPRWLIRRVDLWILSL